MDDHPRIVRAVKLHNLSVDIHVPHQHRQERLSAVDSRLKVRVVAHQLISRRGIDPRAPQGVSSDRVAVAATFAQVV